MIRMISLLFIYRCYHHIVSQRIQLSKLCDITYIFIATMEKFVQIQRSYTAKQSTDYLRLSRRLRREARIAGQHHIHVMSLPGGNPVSIDSTVTPFGCHQLTKSDVTKNFVVADNILSMPS